MIYITDADYADVIALFAVVEGTDLNVNTDKTKYMYFNISSLNGGSLK